MKNIDLFRQDVDSFVELRKPPNSQGFIALPKGYGMHLGIVLVHEWWGVNENIKFMAKLFAKNGYVAYAVDLFGGAVTENADKAMQLATMVRSNQEAAIGKMKAAVRYLREKEHVDKVASIGWCLGGGESLLLALNENMDATVIYYGNLINDAALLKKIRWPVLGIFGDKDVVVTPDSVASFRKAIVTLGIKNEIYMYPGVGHAFANPSGKAYSQKATLDAWDKTISFLDKNMK